MLAFQIWAMREPSASESTTPLSVVIVLSMIACARCAVVELLLIPMATGRFWLIVSVPRRVVKGISKLMALTFSGVAIVCVCAFATLTDAVVTTMTATDCNRREWNRFLWTARMLAPVVQGKPQRDEIKSLTLS